MAFVKKKLAGGVGLIVRIVPPSLAALTKPALGAGSPGVDAMCYKTEVWGRGGWLIDD